MPSGAALVGATLGLGLYGALLWRLLGPLRDLLERARQVAINPVGQWVYCGRRDEFSELDFALRMRDMEAGAIVGRLAEAARQLAEQAEQLQGAVARGDASSQQQQCETRQIAQAIEEMAASIREVAHNAQHSASTAGVSDRAVRDGDEQVRATGQRIASLAREMRRATAAVQSLQASSARINSVIGVIEAIAGQTNLLALNAAIEAARAGEAGRGFAVVADEVRNLAIRTQDSTAQIQDILGGLQDEIDGAVRAMQAGDQEVALSERQAELAAQTLAEIHAQVGAIAATSGQIASAVEQQGAASQAIHLGIEGIHQATAQQAAHSRDSHRAAAGVSRQAEQLRQLARQFWNKRLTEKRR